MSGVAWATVVVVVSPVAARTSGADVVVAPAVSGTVVSGTVVEVAALAKRKPLPGAGTVVGAIVVVAIVVEVASINDVDVAPTTVVVAPAAVVVDDPSFGTPDWRTGRIKTSPVRPTMSRARFWSFTPGRLMTTVSP
jgi:hypothetical protein